MERNFTRPKVGDEFHIKKRYDKGGWPVIRVLKVRTSTMLVQDMRADGTLPEAHYKRPPRDFRDERGWPRLRKHWRRHRRATSSPQREPVK